MRIPKPNPEVYRLAAERIINGQNTMSCAAIWEACRQLRLTYVSEDLHCEQYRAMFGTVKIYTSDIDGQDTFDPGIRIHKNGVVDTNIEKRVYLYQGHPYWNKSSTPERQEMRALALLLMADIVENP